MGVGRVGGGGKRGGASGAGGAGGAGGVKGGGAVGGAKGAGFAGKVDQAQGLVGPSGVVGSSNVNATDPVTANALDIARQLKSGQIKTKEEATKKLVADILKEKVRMQSRALTAKIAETLQDDPRLSQALERLWGRAQEESPSASPRVPTGGPHQVRALRAEPRGTGAQAVQQRPRDGRARLVRPGRPARGCRALRSQGWRQFPHLCPLPDQGRHF